MAQKRGGNRAGTLRYSWIAAQHYGISSSKQSQWPLGHISKHKLPRLVEAQRKDTWKLVCNARFVRNAKEISYSDMVIFNRGVDHHPTEGDAWGVRICRWLNELGWVSARTLMVSSANCGFRKICFSGCLGTLVVEILGNRIPV